MTSNRQILMASVTTSLFAFILIIMLVAFPEASATDRLQAFAALATIPISIIGTYVVWRTLVTTAEASRAAQKSADAAIAGVELAEQTAKKQLRAYVNIKSIKLVRAAQGFEAYDVQITYRNTGATPAYRLGCVARLRTH